MIQSQRHYQAVIQLLKEYLRDGKLQIGSPIPSSTVLVEELSFSVSSIDDALRALTLLGILDQNEHNVYHLTGDMSRSFSDLFSMMLMMGQFDYASVNRLRRSIELQTLPAIMTNLTEQQQHNLYACLVRMMASEHGDLKADKEFHNIMISASQDQLLISLIRGMSQFMSPLLRDADGDYYFEYWEQLVEIHAELYNALICHNLDAAVRALNTHYDILDDESDNHRI